MFHDLVVKGVACYKKCFKEHSIRECAYNKTLFDEAVVSECVYNETIFDEAVVSECAYNETLFDEAVVRDKEVVGRRQTERLNDGQADPQGAFFVAWMYIQRNRVS